MSDYKSCMVPSCKNTTVTAPSKIFILVPKKASVRIKWFAAMKVEHLSMTAPRFVCQDHFNLKDDLENYMKFKLMPHTNKKIKTNVVPHIFKCQQESVLVADTPTGVLKRTHSQPVTETLLHKSIQVKKRRNVEVAGEVMLPWQEIPSTSKEHSFISDQGKINVIPFRSTDSNNKAVQVSMKEIRAHHVRSIATNTVLSVSHKSSSPIKFNVTSDQATSPVRRLSGDQRRGALAFDVATFQSDCESTTTTDDTTDEYEATDLNSSESFVHDLECEEIRSKLKEATLLSIRSDPKMFLGIPKESYYIVSLLASKSNEVSILLTLKKIKLNESLAILAMQFGMTLSNASIVFKKTLKLIAPLFQELIVSPSPKQIKILLPIPFRARYNNVRAIIDCFEIEIEKPSVATHQSLTWSEYYGCNTIKYLIACTPDGLCIFVSRGYGGRATDDIILEDSKFLDQMRPGTVILADRGFKNSAVLFSRHKVTLVRPPSVFSKAKSTRDDVMLTKQIAALRIHIERVIGRVREFAILKPHSCIDNHHIQYTDLIVIITCGIINIQSKLIRQY